VPDPFGGGGGKERVGYNNSGSEIFEDGAVLAVSFLSVELVK
jgi:hypothetical protein